MSKCPISDCMLTYDETKAKDADAILFRNRLSPSLQDGTLYRRPKNQIWIMYLLEPPHHFDDFSRIGAQINWTATYRHDSELVTPYEKFALRMEYVQELMKFIDVDIYGACGPHKCEKLPGHNCDSILRNYKFSLSFENSNCRWYITEKFWTALEANGGAHCNGAPRSDYEDVAPYKSFIHVDDFAGPQELAAYLHHLDRSDEAYNRYFQWKGTGELIDTRFYCRLCALLHSKIIPAKYYPDFQQWWAGAHVCAKTAPAVLQ
ncbi:Glycoprotein 3-alpha-L-fucosyltransferase A [Hypsibius exemplaris]|uniref:Fucosyltransferase n=1 Tax=Hypsibius exemplaris TaxID=2072580 RepID=A0A9X6NGI8_HYPEX|nr:Glycoprotein 3-alpha-L-fucosyltransferase A [Hypsibius exemplaris]